ncbi:MAG: hypothetical protein ACRDRW_05220, partial [Pseudonocardiaceae bacterium]
MQLRQRGGQPHLDGIGRGDLHPAGVERRGGAEQIGLPAVVPRETAQPLGDRPHSVHMDHPQPRGQRLPGRQGQLGQT